MIEMQIERRGVRDTRVLDAMRGIPRHAFVPPDLLSQAYEDAPLPIGAGQTISQPYMVAAMTAALKLSGNERVMEVGGGCGYQAAVLSKLGREVVTLEYRAELAAATAKRLAEMGYDNIHVHCGDGTLGLPELAPFDAILVAAGAPAPPPPLLAQLADGGRMVIPVGSLENQELQLIERLGPGRLGPGRLGPGRTGPGSSRDTFQTTVLDTCRFVPLIGAHGWKDLPLR
ncbi:MAG: protein-L-isoaspartate(D-aspartate) O-methyltransferase [Acidobacteria bacterium]|nr:protein-L-isoaspartate(D-aspartate) O-methyltransferase [Acidobacteriota bacterium]